MRQLSEVGNQPPSLRHRDFLLSYQQPDELLARRRRKLRRQKWPGAESHPTVGFEPIASEFAVRAWMGRI